MGKGTDIEWCDSTLNLMAGCDGCELWNPKTSVDTCYAGRMTEQYSGRNGWPESFDKPKTFIGRLDSALNWSDLTGTDRPGKPWLNGYPRTIFLNDMGDPFTESLPLMWMVPLVPKMADSPHIYICLTKRGKRMYEFWQELGYIPDNFWLLTSVTNQHTYEARIPWLCALREISPLATLGLSIEPLLDNLVLDSTALNLDWIITGGVSGPGTEPTEADRFRPIRDYCTMAGIRYFHKQNGGAAKTGGAWGGRLLDGQIWGQMPEVEPVLKAEQLVLI